MWHQSGWAAVYAFGALREAWVRTSQQWWRWHQVNVKYFHLFKKEKSFIFSKSLFKIGYTKIGPCREWVSTYWESPIHLSNSFWPIARTKIKNKKYLFKLVTYSVFQTWFHLFFGFFPWLNSPLKDQGAPHIILLLLVLHLRGKFILWKSIQHVVLSEVLWTIKDITPKFNINVKFHGHDILFVSFCSVYLSCFLVSAFCVVFFPKPLKVMREEFSLSHHLFLFIFSFLSRFLVRSCSC